MGRPTHELIHALRVTAERLKTDAPYRWTHQGACNCGHLAQTVTRLSKAELHRMALQKAGDWSAHAVEYCPGSGYPVDHVIEQMLALGLTTDDIVHLERLSDPRVVARLAPLAPLDFRARAHVTAYLEAWADLLAEQLPEKPAAAPPREPLRDECVPPTRAPALVMTTRDPPAGSRRVA